jgi:hypothetical protein
MAAKISQRTSPPRSTARVRRNVAIDFLSEMRRALEIAPADRAKTNIERTKERIPPVPLDSRASTREAKAAYARRRGVDGRTKRCL